MEKNDLYFSMKPIGFFHSVFGQKTGCPRQFGLLNSRGKLRLSFGNNVHNSVISLEEFSHIIIIFVFHLNFHIQKEKSVQEHQEEDQSRNECILSRFNRMKATPPRLNKSVGVFSCRSPYRPNPIGISIGKIVRIVNEKNHTDIFLEGVDMIDGTPVLDIKPYISKYDSIPETRVPQWIEETNFVNSMVINWTENSIMNLKKLMGHLEYYGVEEFESVKSLVESMLKLEPRSSYRIEKSKKEFECFCFYVDNLNVRCVYLKKDVVFIIDIEEKSVSKKLSREERKKRNIEDAANFIKTL